MMIMEACYLKSMSLTKNPDLIPSLKSRAGTYCKRKSSQLLYRHGGISSHVTSCHLHSMQGDDDGREPVINSDWRSFRARLVAREPTTWLAPEAVDTNPSSVELSERWAHPLHEPETGCLLIATEKLDGVHIFERTVVLLLSNGPMGPMGIILNRPSLMSIKETRSTAMDLEGTFSDRPLFFGGPLEEGLFLVGPKMDDDGNDGVGRSGVFGEVMKGLYYGTKESVGCAAEMVKRNVVQVGDFRFFDGYCGWEREQLKEEIRAGYWTAVACSPSVIGLDNAANLGLWEDILALMGRRKLV
ncbi:hypothetical protein AAC387_Pa09g1941 [Persea americana]